MFASPEWLDVALRGLVLSAAAVMWTASSDRWPALFLEDDGV
jgi:hypothetical protein